MREIKFRAWDKKLKYMFKLDDEDYFVNNYGLYERTVVEYQGDVYNFVSDNYVLMQFTGLHDSTKWEDLTEIEQRTWLRSCHESQKRMNTKDDWHGKAIYEGDMLSHRYYKSPVVVTFENGRFIAEDVSILDVSLKVIGNKWENPELLEGKQ